MTERLVLPPKQKAAMMSKSSPFNLREWLIPPVLVPILLALLVVGALLYKTSPA